MKKGIFMDGSICGLKYRAENREAMLESGGIFFYEEGEAITFSVGDQPIGTSIGKPVLTAMDLVAEADCRILKPTHYQVTNLSRLILGVKTFTEEINRAWNRNLYAVDFSLEPQDFEMLDDVQTFLKETGVALPSPARAHNIVRRSAAGILKEEDVKIPTRDGRYVLANVYRPLSDEKVPVIMSMGAFGKSFVNGFTKTQEDADYFDQVEDKFYDEYGSTETKHLLQGTFFKRMGSCFASNPPIPNTDPAETVDPPSGPPALLVPVSEAFEQPVAPDWVPYGYAVINVETYGFGANPGEIKMFGSRDALDYCDAIEWASNQEWSSGKVGLFGASFYAMTQYQAAQFHPKGLAAMIPIMGDYDPYRDYIYSGGGLFNRTDNMDLSEEPGPYSFVDHVLEHPFLDEEGYGSLAEYTAGCDISKIDYPIWTCAEPDASLHGRGSSEAYINCASENKKFTFVNSCGIHFWMYNDFYLNQFRAFFDYWLKGIDSDIMKKEPVQLQMRTGRGNYYWRSEKDWPVPGTEYRRLYLNTTDGSLTLKAPETECSTTYNADVYHSQLHRVEGATFLSEPLTEDMEIAGYFTANLYVSSTTEDMELHMHVRVLDGQGREVIYPAHTSMEKELPLGFGSFKVSHRALLDTGREEIVLHPHTKESYQPLAPGEIVNCAFSSFPTTGVVKAGWRIELDLDPAANRWVCYEESAYRKGAKNSIYSGEGHPSFLQIPVLPKR